MRGISDLFTKFNANHYYIKLEEEQIINWFSLSLFFVLGRQKNILIAPNKQHNKVHVLNMKYTNPNPNLNCCYVKLQPQKNQS